MEIEPIATAQNAFSSKFGVPRQSGLVESVETKIVVNEKFSVPEAFKEIEQYKRLWLIWGFSECHKTEWSPTVRPPRLGGNKRVGVFASRSPFRPNSLGLSNVELVRIEKIGKNIVLFVKGADIMNNTPIYDIKPYLAYCDSYEQAGNGFALTEKGGLLIIDDSHDELKKIPLNLRQGVTDIIAQDPRPQYQEDEREYGFEFGEYNIKFCVKGNKAIILSVNKIN